jgi:hypothetical protein
MSKRNAEPDEQITAQWLAGATVEPDGMPGKVMHSTRLPVEWSQALEAEARRLDTNPSRLMQEIVIDYLRGLAVSETVTVRVADLHRAIDRAARRSAA